jgi:hypothetical protein
MIIEVMRFRGFDHFRRFNYQPAKLYLLGKETPGLKIMDAAAPAKINNLYGVDGNPG